MAIPINVLTAVLKKEAVEAGYPGGLARFLQDHPGTPQDEYLVGVPFMSSGDLQRFIDLLTAISFDISGGFAVGEMFNGEWEPCRGIEFRAQYSDRLNRGWQAIAVLERGNTR